MLYFSRIKRSLPILLISIYVFCTPTAFGKESIYVKEYIYDASELESKATARQNAIKLMKAELLEEVSSFIINENELYRSQNNKDYQSSFQSKIKSISAGSVRSQILEEKWDGDRFWVKARLFVDKDQVSQDLNRIIENGTPQIAPNSNTQPIRHSPEANQPVYAAPTFTPDYSDHVQLAKLADVLMMMSPIKIRVMQYFDMNGKWPSKLEDIGFKESEMTDGEMIHSIKLENNGEIRARLTSQFGKDKYISLKSRSVMGGTSIKWSCVTNLENSLLKMTGQYSCRPEG